jgi:hypothetical protein
MESYNSQPILQKKWGIKRRGVKIKVERIFFKNPLKENKSVRYFAFLTGIFLGGEHKEYLGECDSLGRPF